MSHGLEHSMLTTYEDFLHDIKTPMSIIYCHLHYLEELESLYELTSDHVSAIKKCWFRILKLINDTDDRCKIQGGHFAPKLENCDIVALLKESVQLARPLGESKNIKVSFSCNLRQKIVATDKNLLDRIAFNLLSNAIKFTRANGKIEVMLKSQEDSFRFIVRDSGGGISEEAMQHIFKRYYREKSTKNATGNGIGLTIVQEFARLLGGGIHMNSDRKGTEVIVELPVSPAREASGCFRIFDDFNSHYLAQIEFSDNYLEA